MSMATALTAPDTADRWRRDGRRALVGLGVVVLLMLGEVAWDRARIWARFDGPVTALTVAPDGNYLACVVDRQTVHVYDYATRKELASYRYPGQGMPAGVAFVPGQPAVVIYGVGLYYWRFDSAGRPAKIDGLGGPDFVNVRAAVVTRDGSQAVLTTGTGLQIAPLPGGPPRPLPAAHGGTGALALSPDERVAAISDLFREDGQALLYDLIERAPRAWLRDGTRPVSFGTADFSRDGKILYAGHPYPAAYSTSTGKVVGDVPGWISPRQLKVLPDGRRALALTGERQPRVCVVDLTTGREIVAQRRYAEPVNAVDLAPGATAALTGGADGTIRVWSFPKH
jgi:WD40 repeat protein